MDYSKIQENRKKRITKLNKKNPLHGWYVDDSNFIKHIYSKYDSNSYVEVTAVTEDKTNPYPQNIKASYIGLVNEYLGNAPPKPNVLTMLISKIQEEMNDKRIF